MTDYQYLYTLSRRLEDAERAGKAGAVAAAARKFLTKLRARVPIDCFSARPPSSQMLWHTLAPDIKPEEYGRIRDECARYIVALAGP